MHYNNWNEGVGGLATELNLLNTQVRKNSLNIAQILQSSPDPCHVITSVRSQPLSSFILQPEIGYNPLQQICFRVILYLKQIQRGKFTTLICKYLG